MYSQIHKFLIQHKKVSIPGIGSFSFNNKTAFTNADGNILHAPLPTISFTSETALADKNFYTFLAKELHVEEIDAIKSFHEFTYHLKNDSSKAESLVLPGIGSLHKQPLGGYEFVQENTLNNYFEPIKIKANTGVALQNTATIAESHPIDALSLKNENFADINLNEEEVTEPKTDYWWIYAIVLALLGIAAIIYKLQLLS